MKFVKWFEEVGTGDVGLVGGKNASLGEMIRNLQDKGVNVPSGFAITAEAYKYVIEKAAGQPEAAMSMPSKILTIPLVQIQSAERLATTSELNLASVWQQATMKRGDGQSSSTHEDVKSGSLLNKTIEPSEGKLRRSLLSWIIAPPPFHTTSCAPKFNRYYIKVIF